MNRMISRIAAAALMTGWIAALPGLPPAQAQQPARSQGSLSASFSAIERSIIDEYYRLKARVTGEAAAQPGTDQPRRAGTLTRSVPREPQPGAPLPAGARKDPLPADLQARLPAAGPGTERVLVGNDVVLLDPRRNVVLDVIRGAAAAKP